MAMDGAIPKKVYMHYEDQIKEELSLTLKMTVPSKWSNKTADDLKNFFVEHYNTKKPENPLDPLHHHLEKKSAVPLYSDELLQTAIKKHDDIFLKPGASTPKPVAKPAKREIKDSNLIQCRNYGCQQKFRDEENHDQACRHHAQPPTFHDLKKGWQCCSSKMVYDWDDFERIEPCMVSCHSATAPSAGLSKSPAASNDEQPCAPKPVLKSIEEYNQKNPDAVTAVSCTMSSEKKTTPPIRTDGKARCVNHGCQKEYVVTENDEDACKYHTGAPVFHDAVKYWSCCPKNVKYDFDEFLTVPGCAVGPHKDTK